MDKVPLVLQIIRMDEKGNRLVLSKEVGEKFVAIELTDLKEQATINLNFYQLLGMMNELAIAEKKEKNKQVLLGA